MSWLPMSGSVEMVEDHVVARDRDERDQHHPEQLHDRPHAPDVVHEAERARPGPSRRGSRARRLDVDEDRHRHEDPDDDREPADSGHRSRVDSRPVASCRRLRRCAGRARRRSASAPGRCRPRRGTPRAPTSPPRARGGSPGRTWKVLIAEGIDDPHWYDRTLVTELVTSAADLRRTPAHARGEDRDRRPRLRGAAAGDGVRRDRLRGHRHRSGRFEGERAPGGPLLPRRRSGRALRQGRRAAQADHRLRARSAELDALTICVPTPLSKTRTPDLSYIVSAAESVAAHLRHGQLVVLQSTTYPGTTEEVVLPILESAGGRVGRDFFLGYAPERVDPGNEQYTIKNTPKLIAGVTDECRRRTELLYSEIVDTIVPVLVDARRRDREDPREHLPRGQHRAGERAGAHVRQARHLRLGGDRGRRDQAVRLPHPLPRPRPRRRLHPDRPALPGLAAARVRLLGADDRGRARGQRAHADVRRAEGRRRAQRRRASRSRTRRSCCSAWRTRRTSTTRASRRASRSCAS